MKAAAFQPSGDLPRWRIIFDLASGLDHGTVIPYSELEPLFNNNRPLVSGAVRAANRHLREQVNKMLVNVPNVGYRVLEPREHVLVAEKKRREARRKVTLALDIVTSTNRDSLTSDEKARLDTVERAMGVLIGHLRQQSKTLARHDQLIRTLGQRVEKLEEVTEGVNR